MFENWDRFPERLVGRLEVLFEEIDSLYGDGGDGFQMAFVNIYNELNEYFQVTMPPKLQVSQPSLQKYWDIVFLVDYKTVVHLNELVENGSISELVAIKTFASAILAVFRSKNNGHVKILSEINENLRFCEFLYTFRTFVTYFTHSCLFFSFFCVAYVHNMIRANRNLAFVRLKLNGWEPVVDFILFGLQKALFSEPYIEEIDIYVENRKVFDGISKFKTKEFLMGISSLMITFREMGAFMVQEIDMNQWT